MNKQIIFCVECTNGKKKIDKKSDELYINKLLKFFYDEVEGKNKIVFVHMGGKHRYKNKDTKNQIKEEIKNFKYKDANAISEVVYVIDKDKFDSVPQDEEFVENIEKYCKDQKYKLIFFTRNIEQVLLGRTVGRNKSKKANEYEINENDKEELRKKLSNDNPNANGTSNFLKIIEKIFEDKNH